MDQDLSRPVNLVVLESRAIRLLFTTIRDKTTKCAEYSTHVDRLLRIIAEEGIANLRNSIPCTVETPCGVYEGVRQPSNESICVVSIIRSGDILCEAVRQIIPGCAVGKILIQRDEEDPEKRPKLFYSKLPPNISQMTVILVDPMLATGGSAIMAIEVLHQAGVREESVQFLNVVCAPEGLKALALRYPNVQVVTAAVDQCLNREKYIVPGLGDFGDRYFGTQ